MDKREQARAIQQFAEATKSMTVMAAKLHREGLIPDEGLADAILMGKWVKHAAEYIVTAVGHKEIADRVNDHTKGMQDLLERLEKARKQP